MVKNTGKYVGEEVAQIYIRNKMANIVRSVKEMKWLCKFKLEPVESKGIKFILTEAELCFYNYPGEFIVDKREFDVMVGTNSQLGIS